MCNQNSNLSYEQALIRATKFCAYQERYQQQVKQKLSDLRVDRKDIDAIICYLIEHNYLNEQRFACAYARGKLRIKHWGILKIKAQLKYLGLSDNCINQALQEIDAMEYLTILNQQLVRRLEHKKMADNWTQQQDARQYLMARGFEPNKVDDIIKTHYANKEKE
jgi:regulatory protein